MKAIALLSLAAATAFAQDLKYPASFSLEVDFAGKNATKNVKGDPSVFSIHNMDQDFHIGYSIDWEIAGSKKTYNGTLAVASIVPAEGKHALDKIWIADGGIPKVKDVPAGDYTFSYTWKMTDAIREGKMITYDVGEKVMAGKVDFTVSDQDEDKKKGSDAIFGTKMSFKSSESTEVGKSSQSLTACVDHAGADKNQCAKMDRKEVELDSNDVGKGDDGDKSDPPNAGSRVATSQVGSLALLIAIGGAFLL